MSSAALREGFDALGAAYESPLVLSTRLGPDRHDGAAAFRVSRYDRGCGCLRYEGPVF